VPPGYQTSNRECRQSSSGRICAGSTPGTAKLLLISAAPGRISLRAFRHSAGIGEGVITAITEAGLGGKPIKRVVGADTYTPLAGAAFLVIPKDEDIVAAAGAF
jgi:hypothetical protein